jgi:hypothetical protein
LLILLRSRFSQLFQLVIVLPDLDEFLFPLFVLRLCLLLLFLLFWGGALLSLSLLFFHALDHDLLGGVLFY